LDTTTVAALSVLILVAALLYSSVGHAGASGYLAAMALFNVAPEVMKPAALALNVLVAAIATFKFSRAGCFSWRLFWPFAVTSIPFAFLGGLISLPTSIYKPIVGAVLLYAAVGLFFRTRRESPTSLTPPAMWVALIFGVVIGLLSGLTGVGGGIFLSPLLLMMGWAEMKQTAGVSAAFILVNSIAGLSGLVSSIGLVPRSIAFWGAAALVGGWIGAGYGSRRLASVTLRRLLSIVLVIAGLKMIFV